MNQFEQWYFNNVGVTLDHAKRAGVTDLDLLERAFNAHSLPDDITSHRNAWRNALTIALHESQLPEDVAYWTHELKVFDAVHSELEQSSKSVPTATVEVNHNQWNRTIRDRVDALLKEAGFAEDSSVRHQLACMNFDQEAAKPVWYHKDWGGGNSIFYDPATDKIPKGAVPLYSAAVSGGPTPPSATDHTDQPVHFRAVLDPAERTQQVKTSMHIVGFRTLKAAEAFTEEQLDFYGWRYTIEPLYAHPKPKVDIDALTDIIAQSLQGTYYCGRVWSAWRVGTMSESDFWPVDEGDIPHEIATLVVEALSADVVEDKPISVTDAMAIAFHQTMSDDDLGEDDIDEIKKGLTAALVVMEQQ